MSLDSDGVEMRKPDEQKAIDVMGEQSLVAVHLFHGAIDTLRAGGWYQDKDSTTPWYWWRNDELKTGSCAIEVALRYEYQRNPIK